MGKMAAPVIGLVTATATAGFVFLGPLRDASAERAAAPAAAPRLIEAPNCSAPPATAPAAADAALAGASGGTTAVQRITVTVPATAIIRIDATGRILSAMTNTRCAPRPTDDIYLAGEDGKLVESSYPVIANHVWVGDFTQPGAFQPQ